MECGSRQANIPFILNQQQQQAQQQAQQQQNQQVQPQRQQQQPPLQYQQQQFKRPDAQPIQNVFVFVKLNFLCKTHIRDMFQVNISTYNTSPSHSEAFTLLTQETPQWMSRRDSNKEAAEWVDNENGSVKNKFSSPEERPQQNAPKVTLLFHSVRLNLKKK